MKFQRQEKGDRWELEIRLDGASGARWTKETVTDRNRIKSREVVILKVRFKKQFGRDGSKMKWKLVPERREVIEWKQGHRFKSGRRHKEVIIIT